jgi:hypothetical protein
MPEEIIETEEIQEEVVDAETQNEVTDDETKETEENLQEVTDEEAKKSAIGKIGDMVKNFVSGKGDETVDEEGADIPDEFTTAASKAGWTDEDIVEFTSDYTDEQLIEMIPSLTTDSVETEKTEEKSEEKSEKTEVKVENSQEDEKTKKLLERIEALEKAQGKSQEEIEQQELAGRIHRANQMFDEKSKEFDVFGKTGEMPKFPGGKIIPTSPQMKARQEVWDVAALLHKSGMDFDKAMSVSLNAYKGKNLSKDVKRSIIKDLKKNEKKLSGKHTSHESANVAEYGPDVIREIARRAGRDIN